MDLVSSRLSDSESLVGSSMSATERRQAAIAAVKMQRKLGQYPQQVAVTRASGTSVMLPPQQLHAVGSVRTQAQIDQDMVDSWADVEVTDESPLVDLLRHRSHALVSGVRANPDAMSPRCTLVDTDTRLHRLRLNTPFTLVVVCARSTELHFAADFSRAAVALHDLTNIVSLAEREEEPVSLVEGKGVYKRMDANGDGDKPSPLHP